MEDAEARKRRFEEGPPQEIVLTLLNSIDNTLNREIEIAAANGCWYLVMLGIHAVALTLAEGLFDQRGPDGYRNFLVTFVDRDEEGFDFSSISSEIHDHRNVLAHQWLSVSGHEFGYDETLAIGWEIRDGITWLSPKHYYEAFRAAFSAGGRIWAWQDFLSAEEQQAAKVRLLEKFQR